MALTDDDLSFVISLSPDVSSIEKAIDEVVKVADKAGAGPAGMPGRPMGGPSDVSKLLGALVGGQAGGGRLGQFGGMAGEMLGGPIGAIIGGMLAEALPKALAAPAQAAAKALDTVGVALKGLQGVLGPVGAGLDLVTTAMKGIADKVKDIPIVGDVLGPALDAASAIPGTIKTILETLTAFAAKASPAMFRQLQIAVDDVQATIGSKFIPVMNLMRSTVRLVGDMLATVLPSTGTVEHALKPLRDLINDPAWRQFASDVGPMVREFLVANLKGLAAALTAVGATAHAALLPLQAMGEVFNALTGAVPTMGSSVGAAAQPAQFSSIRGYEEKLQQEAYSQPPEGGRRESVQSNVQRIVELLERLLTGSERGRGIGAVADQFGTGAAAAGAAFGGAGGVLAEAARKLFGGGNTVRRGGGPGGIPQGGPVF
jgi:hypothetical protein